MCTNERAYLIERATREMCAFVKLVASLISSVYIIARISLVYDFNIVYGNAECTYIQNNDGFRSFLVYFSFTTRKFGFLYSLLDASTMVRSVL